MPRAGGCRLGGQVDRMLVAWVLSLCKGKQEVQLCRKVGGEGTDVAYVVLVVGLTCMLVSACNVMLTGTLMSIYAHTHTHTHTHTWLHAHTHIRTLLRVLQLRAGPARCHPRCHTITGSSTCMRDDRVHQALPISCSVRRVHVRYLVPRSHSLCVNVLVHIP